MSLTTSIVITHEQTLAQIQGLIRDKGDRKSMLQDLIDYLYGLQGGLKNASLDLQLGMGASVQASGTVTFTGAPSNNETLVINGVTFTAKTSGATGNQFNIGGTVTITATNLAAAVNASVTDGIKQVLTATSAAGVVTLTAIAHGYVGNSIPLTESLTNATASGSGNFTGGVTKTANVYHYGL